MRNQQNGISVTVRASISVWNLDFSAPAKAVLTPGTYAPVNRYPLTSFNGLSVTNDSRGCIQLTGRFVVLAVSYAPDGTVETFAADVEQHCGDNNAALFGAIRYNSTLDASSIRRCISSLRALHHRVTARNRYWRQHRVWRR